MTFPLRYATVILSCCTALLTGFGAVAQTQYPDKPITSLIPYPPGGSADMLAHPLAASLQKTLGQTIVIEYKPGAGGSIVSSQLARSPADGYTLLMVLAAHAINPSMYPSLPYDTRNDFAPVSLVATLPMLLSAPLSTPANSIDELIAYAKEHPSKLTFASAGNGNTSHLAGEIFKQATGINMLHIPYKGSGPAVVALLSGEVSLMFDSISTSLPHVKAGKLKGLAVTGAQRSALLSNVPTIQESGVPDFVIDGWYGILAPAGTPEKIVNTLSQAVAAELQKPALRQQLNDYDYELVGSTPDAFAKHIENEIVRWENAVNASGARVQ
jgi:tripartite-type tricarboxylate transporter receptor subunit TctC